MRILVASGIFPPDPGGPSTHLGQLIPELVARGHEVRAVVFGHAAGGPPGCVATRIPLDLPLPARALRYARAYWREARHADRVYVATMGLPRPPCRPPVILRVPGDPAWERAVNRGLVPPGTDIDAFQTARSRARVACLKWARAVEAQRADRVLVPSDYLRRMVAAWNVDAEKIAVVYSAVDDGRGDGRAIDRHAAREALGWDAAGQYVVTAARLTAWKGVDHLIDAVARVPGVTLVVAGDGPQRQSLAARAASSGAAVRFTGMLPRERLATHISAADYVALYSGYEGFSHLLLEALAAGTPVIASARGGNPEIVRDRVNGFLVTHPDSDALAAAISRAFAGGTRARLAARTGDGLARFRASAAIPAVADAIETAGPRAAAVPCAS